LPGRCRGRWASSCRSNRHRRNQHGKGAASISEGGFEVKDIIEIKMGEDLKVFDSIVSKAGNVLSVQLGALEYAPDFGVDLRFFLESDFKFQNESFKSYLVQRLTEHQINVAQIRETVGAFFHKYTYFVGDNDASSGGMIL
jgi:hypothetical protein